MHLGRSWKNAMGASMLVLTFAAQRALAGDNFIKPTDEELKMTEQAGYPGVPAVVLFREVITDDDNHSQVHYERIKVLTEKGKEYANVELRFVTSKSMGSYFDGDEKNITDIQGRTIHPDGTIIPFSGKPYQKTFVNASLYKYQARVFTLPDVEVGSIIEYRYITRIADNLYEPPQWYVQGDLYTRKAHFKWVPTMKELSSEKGTVNSISYFPVLPAGTELQKLTRPGGAGTVFELSAKDIPPSPHDDHMPPIDSFTYRVMFSYMPYRSAAEYWKSEGSSWSKRLNSFIGPDGPLKADTETVIGTAATSDEKLRKIYAAVMQFENTDYTRNRERNEDKAEGLNKISKASDVFAHKRGSSSQLTALFVGMARAAGFKAYLAYVPDRSKTLFVPEWMSFYQFDDYVAIVNVDGTEKYFDPGTRYCDYGTLAWQHSYARGIRQTEGGTDFAQLPIDSYTANKTTRIGDLTLQQNGEVHGTITLAFSGAPALAWRQRALTGDQESLRRLLRENLESMVPKGLEVAVTSVDGADTYDKPLSVVFEAKGVLGTPTGKRLLLPSDIFVSTAPPEFPHAKREIPVYYEYAQSIHDAVRIKFPEQFSLEVTPATVKTQFLQSAAYALSADIKPNSITTHRSLISNTIAVPLKDYPTLRSFYSELEAKDREPIVLKAGAAPAGAAGN